MSQLPVVCIGFITYGEATARYLPIFLKSLQHQSYQTCRIVAFDNTEAEDNDNIHELKKYPQVGILRNGKNIGFSAAYNILIDRAVASGADYFFVINPDTCLEPDVIEKLVAVLEADSGLASVSPTIRQWDFKTNEKKEIIDSRGLRVRPGLRFSDCDQGLPDSFQRTRISIIGPSGAAGLYRCSALARIKEKSGYFDERFFMYKEDCDLAYRLALDGFACQPVPEAVLYHDRTASGGSLIKRISGRSVRPRTANYYSFVNQHLLYIKHWRHQSIYSRCIVCAEIVARFFEALLLEPYLLSGYKPIWTFLSSSSRGTSKIN